MKIFINKQDAFYHFDGIGLKTAKEKFDVLRISSKELKDLSIDELREKITEIDSILDKDKLRLTYHKSRDFDLFENLENSGSLIISINLEKYFIDKKREILDTINKKETETKIESISELINKISEEDIRQKLDQQLKELEEQANKFKIEEKQLDAQEETFNSEKKALELQQSKLEIFDKKSQVWLRIFGKESIASILGGFLLLVMSISFIAAMFTETEVSNIVESAFLLILGYFFGQSVKNDK